MNPVSTYQTDAILSMPPEQILLRLYDALLVRLTDAEQKIENGDTKAASVSISKALDIVTALREALDPTVDAKAGPMLDRLYGVVSQWLLEANLERSVQPIKNSTRILTTLREGWCDAVQQVA